jgi:hypothetical protein
VRFVAKKLDEIRGRKKAPGYRHDHNIVPHRQSKIPKHSVVCISRFTG